ncbi:MAG: protein-disulfide reductase DsbD [Gammaproteobacteria bacterium]|nr:protein-disulfide reductase DsbD [Gammaproteobacteria bacterium]
MRNIALIFVWCLITFTVNYSYASTDNLPLLNKIEWQKYSEAVFTQAQTNKHLILIYGKSKTCHWCQEMDKNTWQSAAIIKRIQTDYIPIIVDVDSEFDLVTKYRMTSLPTTLVVDSDNHTIKIFSGYFPPDFMEKHLKEITDDYSHSNNIRSAITKEDLPPKNSLIPTDLRDNLEKKQIAIFKKIPNSHLQNPSYPGNNEIDLNSIGYALTFAPHDEKLIHAWVNSTLSDYLVLNDPVWGGIYTHLPNGSIDYAKKTLLQGINLHVLSQVNIYWPNSSYIVIAKKIIDDINSFLTSPDGTFFAGQNAYSLIQKENDQYYQLDDSHRRHIGIPKIDIHIYADVNGWMIQGLTDFYMATGDSSALDKAIKANDWIVAHLSIMDGGFRHEKSINDAIYLNDTLAMGNALLTLYKATMNPDYLNRATDAAKFINLYLQNADGKFGYISYLDSKKSPDAPLELKAAENAEVIRFTSLLHSYTGDKFLQDMSLSSFKYLMQADVLEKSTPATILLAESRIANPPIHIVIIGAKNDTVAKNLYQTALSSTAFFSRIDWWDRKGNPLLNSDAEYPVMDKSAAYICYAFHCSFPIYKTTDLSGMIHDLILPIASTKSSLDSNVTTKISPLNLTDNSSHNAEQLLAKKNVFLMIIGFLLFGLLLSFTPCLLPLIPIMASIIVGRTIGVKKEKTFLLCLAYVISMSLTYSLLGVLAGEFGLYLQAYMQETWVLILFSLLFLLLGLSMLDAYELKLPSAFLHKISAWSNSQKGGNYPGVIIMGALSTLIVSPCVSAPLAGALSFITKTGDYTLGAVGLFFMGFGMGLPLLILSLFSKNILPRVSRWNKNIKTAFGIVSLGLSIWIISRAISDALSMALWSAWLIFTAINMGIFKRKTKKLFDKFWKTLAIMVFLYGSALLFNSVLINSDFYNKFLISQKLSSPTLTDVTFKTIKNQPELEQALNIAKEKHLPVLLDFSAKWCISCINMERHTLTSPDVMLFLNKFVLLRVDLTNLDNESLSLAREFKISAPPIMVFFNQDGKLIELRASGELDVPAFTQILKQALSSE